MAFWSWSRTAGSNAAADSTINWAEGQAPSSINDSARAMMARVAEYRDDMAGATNTAGTSTAYTLSSFQVFDTLAHMDGQIVAFTPHTTNGASATLNVDGLGAKPVFSNGANLQAGVLIQGTPYVALYNNAVGAFYLRGLYGNPYNIPLGAGIDYYGGSAPNSAFAFPYGQAISRTTYATLFSLLGTTFGVGDGSTTFNIPDRRGTVAAMQDNVGTGAAGRLTGAFGAIIGEQAHTLTAGELPGHTHSGTTGVMNANASHSHTPTISGGTGNGQFLQGGGTGGGVGGGGNFGVAGTVGTTAANIDHTHNFTTDNGNSGGIQGFAHNNVQPTFVCNHIMRIL